MCFQLPINSPEIRSTSNHMIISNNISIFIPDEAWPRPLRHLKYIQCEHILPIISQTESKLTKPEKQRWTAITITGNTSSRLSSSTISTNSNARELLTYKEKKKRTILIDRSPGSKISNIHNGRCILLEETNSSKFISLQFPGWSDYKSRGRVNVCYIERERQGNGSACHKNTIHKLLPVVGLVTGRGIVRANTPSADHTAGETRYFPAE